MFVRRPSSMALLLAAGLTIALPSLAIAAPTETPAPKSSVSVPAATGQHRIEVVQPADPFDDAILQGTKPEGQKATVTTPWGARYDVAAAGTDVTVTVACPPAGWVAGNTYQVTYVPEVGQALTLEVLLRNSGEKASVDQPKSRFDTAWVILPSAEKGPFTIKTDYGFNQKYGEAPYGVFPPPAGGWEPGKSYRVEVRYASGRSGVVQVKLPVNAEDPGIRGTLSGPDAKGTLTVQLTGVPVGEEVRVALYAGTIVSEVTSDGGRAASASPSYRLTPAGGWKKGQTYIVVATVGFEHPMGDHRWVQSFTYDGTAKPGKPAPQPGKPTPKPTHPKDREGGLAKTGW